MIVFALQPNDTGLVQITNDEGDCIISEPFDVLNYELVKDDALKLCQEHNINCRTVIDPRFIKKLTELRYATLDDEGMLEQFI